MHPSISGAGRAVVEIARYFGWRDLAVLTQQGESGAMLTRSILDYIIDVGDAMETKVLLHQQFDPRDVRGLKSILLTLRVLEVRVVVFHCESSQVKSVFGAAKQNGLLAADRVWIVTEPVIEACSAGASNCPSGLIGLRPRRPHNSGTNGATNIRDGLVHDSLVVFADALRRLMETNVAYDLPRWSCTEQAPHQNDELFG